MTTTTLTAPTPVRDRFAVARAAWRSILVHVQPEREAGPRLAAAADLARKLDATLIGLAAEMIPPQLLSDPYGVMAGDFIGALTDGLQTNLNQAKNAFDAASSGTTHQWLAVQDRPDDAVERICRGADLIVAGGAPLNERDTWRCANPAELVIKAGRPVLVVPPAGGTLAAESVVVAWKDSRESRRALADALPLLAAADLVTIVEIADEADFEALETHHDSLRAHLKRHEIVAQSRILKGRSEEASTTLQATRKAVGADLIVAGAYGHSRFGEWVFGGVTGELLADPQAFILFSH